MQNFKKKIHKTLLTHLLVFLVLPNPCFAYGGTTPESIIQNIIDYLTGDLARLVGIIVLVGAGYLFLDGQRIQKSTFVRIVIGMGLILGAPTLAGLWWG